MHLPLLLEQACVTDDAPFAIAALQIDAKHEEALPAFATRR
jgi:hypothetical protein